MDNDTFNDNTLDFISHKKMKALKSNVRELRDINKILSTSLISLTKYDKYSSVKKVLEDLFILHSDIKRAIHSKEEILTRLKNE